MYIHMLKNSAVLPLSRATKPRPRTAGSGLTLLAMNEEFSSVLRPYTAGSINGTSEVFRSSQNSSTRPAFNTASKYL
ncbi:hypothetical protein D3C81_1938870 [compost metagenome]